MKRLLRDAWKEPEFWVFVIFFGLLMMGCLTIVGYMQRAEFYRRIDSSNRQMIMEINAEIEKIRAQNERSVSDRQEIHKAVNAVKKTVEAVKKSEGW